MKKKLFLLLTLAILFSMLQGACKMIVKMAGLYQDPKPETPESIIAYCQKHDAYYDYLYMPINDSAITAMSKVGKLSIGDMEPFNHEKLPIFIYHRRGPNGCPNSLQNLYQSSDTSIISIGDDANYFWDKLSFYQLIDKRTDIPDLADTEGSYDFYLITTWSTVMAKHTKSVFDYVHKAALIDPSKKACVILLDIDARGGKAYFKSLEKLEKKEKKEEKKAMKSKK